MKVMKRIYRKLIGSNPTHESVEQNSTPIFDRPFYRDITEARIKHLRDMNLDIKDKIVIDIGCGIGHFSEYFTSMNCNLLCIDGRSENIVELKKRYPLIRSAVIDVESDKFLSLGEFDIVFCYGLIYHLTNPMSFIQNVGQICKDMAILETCIMDAEDPVLRLVREDQDNPTQALHPNGCRPSPAFVIECLISAGFSYVYTPIKMPDHPQFNYTLTNDYTHIKNGNLIRGIFIAAKNPVDNTSLQKCF